MNSTSILIICLALAAASIAVVALPGGWQPIEDLKEPRVIEIAEFAVKTYNQRKKTALVFVSVVGGETQVVSGMNYRLVIAAKDGSGSGKYEAVVWDKPWTGFRDLTSFKRV